jgi:hypothetical protein
MRESKKAGGFYQTARPGIRDVAHPRETTSRATALLRYRCFQQAVALDVRLRMDALI